MQTRIGHFCMVLDFLDVGFSTNHISGILKKELDDIIANFSFESLEDWTLVFEASYTNGRQPLVSKNRFGSYTSDKTKEIKVVIPVPTIKDVPWGVEESQHIHKESHYDELMKNFHSLDVKYIDYSNRTDYILKCMRSGIKKSFDEGFTINKVKIKFKIENFSS